MEREIHIDANQMLLDCHKHKFYGAFSSEVC